MTLLHSPRYRRVRRPTSGTGAAGESRDPLRRLLRGVAIGAAAATLAASDVAAQEHPIPQKPTSLYDLLSVPPEDQISIDPPRTEIMSEEELEAYRERTRRIVDGIDQGEILVVSARVILPDTWIRGPTYVPLDRRTVELAVTRSLANPGEWLRAPPKDLLDERESLANTTRSVRTNLARNLSRVEEELEARVEAGGLAPGDEYGAGSKFDPEHWRSVQEWLDFKNWRLSITLPAPEEGSGRPGAEEGLNYRGLLEVHFVLCQTEGAGEHFDVRVTCDLDGLFYLDDSSLPPVADGSLWVSGSYDEGSLELEIDDPPQIRLSGTLFHTIGNASGKATYLGSSGTFLDGGFRLYR